ncbi:MAG: glycerol-3-phosphate 1-O-acyltransferase PlsY [Gemmatimonadetes bacterium]|nr:glycerol-3-phosphate 1-O-acyltransferase PlsY [Gemmatimonadota bacterium]
MTPWLLLGAAYLLAASPTSYVAGKLFGKIDLRHHGSGNLGATNVLRVLGWRVALPVFVLDVLKGWFPTFAFPRWDGVGPWQWALGYGAAAILGHVFSPYVRFKGGKGVATSAGVLLAFSPPAAGLGLLVWAALLLATRIVSLASMGAALAMPAAVYAFRGADLVLGLSIALAAFVIYAHRTNIRRLLRGEEHRFGARTWGAR